MMIILGLADIHGETNCIDKIGSHLEKADVVCIAGDITHFGRTAETGRVINALCRYAQRVLAVTGNCDYREVEAYLDEKDINLHARVKTINGVNFLGLGGSLTTPFKTPNEYTDEELGRFLDQAKEYLSDDLPLVVVSHQPPLNTICDRLNAGHHVGSRLLYEFIEQYQPLVCITGHIHEAVGTDRIGKTQIVNPGQTGRGRYAYAEVEKGGATVEVRNV